MVKVKADLHLKKNEEDCPEKLMGGGMHAKQRLPE